MYIGIAGLKYTTASVGISSIPHISSFTISIFTSCPTFPFPVLINISYLHVPYSLFFFTNLDFFFFLLRTYRPAHTLAFCSLFYFYLIHLLFYSIFCFICVFSFPFFLFLLYSLWKCQLSTAHIVYVMYNDFNTEKFSFRSRDVWYANHTHLADLVWSNYFYLLLHSSQPVIQN